MSSANSNPRSPGGQVRSPGMPPRVNAPARPAQRPASGGGQPAARPGQQRPAQQRPNQQRPAQQGPGLVKPAPKAKARKARLLVSKVDPWSVLKMSFLLSVALGVVTVVASFVIWTVLDLTGIFDGVNELLGEIAGSEGGGFDLRQFASLTQVLSTATIIAVVNVILLTTLAMLSAVLYNISSSLVGGIGVTLTDD